MSALALAFTGCVDQPLPAELPVEGRNVAFNAVGSRTFDEARASLEDVIVRILPVLDAEAVPAGFRSMLEQLDRQLGESNEAATRSEIVRAQVTLDAYEPAPGSSIAAELDAIRLALGAAQRALLTRGP